jgi:ribosomal protein S12 methylthiotransferase accessory factor
MTDPDNPLAPRFRGAAAALSGGPAAVGVTDEARALLQFLDYDVSDTNVAPGRANLLLAAARFRRLFQLPVPDAPGLVFCGAEADPACLGTQYSGLPVGSFAGSGLTPRRAFESCVGEGIEYLSQFARDSDAIASGTLKERGGSLDDASRGFVAKVLAACDIDPERPIDWVRVHRLPNGTGPDGAGPDGAGPDGAGPDGAGPDGTHPVWTHPVWTYPVGTDAWFPADLCLRRPAPPRDFTAPLKLSTGCAAGATDDDATLRATLELVERDAAALWWRGGRRGRAIAPDSEAGLAAAALLEQLRKGQQHRRTWLLDIATDLEIPAIVALSANEDGFGLAFGLAARTHPAAAARAAIFELCQVELAYHVIVARQREPGDVVLNDQDQQRMRLRGQIDTRNCPLLQPRGDSRLAPLANPDDSVSGLRAVRQRFAAAGIATYRRTLTRPEFQVPVVRVIAPGLQSEPCAIVGERLARAMAETGGGAMHTAGLPLL